MEWGNIWEWVKCLVFVRDEGGAESQSIAELLQCGSEDCWNSGIDVGAGCWGLSFISDNPQECVQTDL